MVIFIAITFFAPEGRESEAVELLLTISTFLFAVLAGFYLTRLNTRYDKVRELIASEDSHWLSVYEYSDVLGKKYRKQLTNIIDKYYRATFDYFIGESHRPTQKYMDELYRLLHSLAVTDEK